VSRGESKIALKSAESDCNMLEKRNRAVTLENESLTTKLVDKEDIAARLESKLVDLSVNHETLVTENRSMQHQLAQRWDQKEINSSFTTVGMAKNHMVPQPTWVDTTHSNIYTHLEDSVQDHILDTDAADVATCTESETITNPYSSPDTTRDLSNSTTTKPPQTIIDSKKATPESECYMTGADEKTRSARPVINRLPPHKHFIITDSLGRSLDEKRLIPRYLSTEETSIKVLSGGKIEEVTSLLGNLQHTYLSVSILVGTNNVGKGEGAKEFRKRYEDMVTCALASQPAPVHLVELPPRVDKPGLNRTINEMNKFIQETCSRDKRLHLVSPGIDPRDLDKDGLHLERSGIHKLVVELRRALIPDYVPPRPRRLYSGADHRSENRYSVEENQFLSPFNGKQLSRNPPRRSKFPSGVDLRRPPFPSGDDNRYASPPRRSMPTAGANPGYINSPSWPPPGADSGPHDYSPNWPPPGAPKVKDSSSHGPPGAGYPQPPYAYDYASRRQPTGGLPANDTNLKDLISCVLTKLLSS
jgi:hypothetical protein